MAKRLIAQRDDKASKLLEELLQEIIEETKDDIISIINSQKGNLSKKQVCELIKAYKGGAE